MTSQPFNINPPAIVRAVDEREALAADINAEGEGLEANDRDNLQRALRIGEKVERYREECQKKQEPWRESLEERLTSFSMSKARECLYIYQRRAEWLESSHLGLSGVLLFLRANRPKREGKPGNAGDEPIAITGDRWHIEQADCLDFLRRQPPGSIDLVFGSPPYEDARTYEENGEDHGIARDTETWVKWMVEVYEAALACCKGLVAFVVAGRTKDYRWTASPALLMADLCRKEGIVLRVPPLFRRVGIPGSGGPDWLRNDYEFVVCATNGGKLPWAVPTAMGQPPKYAPGGQPSHRTENGSRVNEPTGYATMEERNSMGPHRARQRAGRIYQPPEIANPGNVIDCSVGGGAMGSKLAHENEAPFPEALAEFFIRSFCPLGGLVCDPFAGSGTTLAVAVEKGRMATGCDLRASQVKITRKRLNNITPPVLLEIPSDDGQFREGEEASALDEN